MPNELSHLRPLIKDGTITVFGHLLEYVTINQLSEIMGCSGTHIRYLLENPLQVRLGEIERLTVAFGYKKWEKVGRLFYEES
jgi:hypothetical protein